MMEEIYDSSFVRVPVREASVTCPNSGEVSSAGSMISLLAFHSSVRPEVFRRLRAARIGNPAMPEV